MMNELERVETTITLSSDGGTLFINTDIDLLSVGRVIVRGKDNLGLVLHVDSDES